MRRYFDATAGTLSAAFPISRLHLRSDLHVARKVWHLFGGVLISSIYWFAGLDRAGAVTVLGVCLGWNLILETLRLRSPTFNQKFMRVAAPIMRSSEIDRVSAVPYYLASAILAIAIFPKTVAVLSILFLAAGDPLASTFGILFGKYGKRFSNGKSLIGTLAGVVTCSLVTLFVLRGLQVPYPQVLFLSLVGGLAGGLAEHLPLEVDDNFSIPVVSGFILWLAFIVAGF